MGSSFFDTVAMLMTLAALFGVLNHKVLKLPFTIGLLVSALVASVMVLVIDHLWPSMELGDAMRSVVLSVDFPEALLGGMLGFLLFAGAMHLDLESLLDRRGPILTLASIGVVISTAVIGVGSYYVFGWMGVHVPFAFCLVFGALISPTDPIAVLGIMKTAGAPKSLEIKVSGESLFNDGIGVIVFTVLLGLAAGGSGHGHGAEESSGLATVGVIFAREVLGGVLLGLVAGYIAYRFMHSLDEPNLEIIISVALVMGIISLAHKFHTSAPLACVIAGLLVGNQGRQLAMSDRTRQALDLVWSFLDEALNALLFLYIGLEVVAVSLDQQNIFIGVLLIPLALLGRFVSVFAPISVLTLRREFPPGTVRVLTWGGLKGGISVALALSLPPFPGREVVLTATYVIVIFSIIVQGLTVGRVVRKVTA